MADPVYRYRTKVSARYVVPGDLIDTLREGEFAEVVKVVSVGERIHAVHRRSNRVSILKPDDQLDLLRPDNLPTYLQESLDG